MLNPVSPNNPGISHADHELQAPSADKPLPQLPASNLDHFLKAYNGRGVANFFNHGGTEQAAQALIAAKHVMLCTGFNVAEGMPETDGPVGTAALGNALAEMGKVVTYVTDGPNEKVLREALAVLNPDRAKYSRIVKFSAPHEKDNDPAAKALLEKLKPDAVVAIELPARNSEGVRRNMRGVDINPFNPPVDGLLLEAAKAGITTVGVGDGGNEAGMGGLDGIPTALDGTEMKSAVPAQHQVTAWNSNLGGEAIAAAFLAKHGELDKLHTPEQQTAMIGAMLDAGAVDGVTRKKVAGALSDDGKTTTGVDGFSPMVHAAGLEMLKNVVGGMNLGIVAKKTPRDGQPFLIGAFDSSNGGLIAAKNLAGFIAARSPHTARFAIVVDHGNAPYGEKSRDALIKLVGNGLQTSEKIGVDVIAMACNTACTAFPEALDQSPHTKVLDLIEVTAGAIARLGGSKPAILSTPATAKGEGDSSKNMYDDKVKQASEGRVSLPPDFRIGATEWAGMINDLDHLSEEKEKVEKVRIAVEKYVDKIPVDATSVWLCCTHYPALKGQIEAALKKNNRDIEVIDPMEYQAEMIIDHLNSIQDLDRSKRRETTDPIVVTTGVKSNVDVSARALLGSDKAIVLQSEFGKKFSLELLADHLVKSPETKSASSLPPNFLPFKKPDDGQSPTIN
ncbi:glutamate cyclase domain-containing protein [Collimonas sp.]|jgi:glutamate racemase|uniref:glutamate cyclase domain-containing protein n=1 Tax=Collimonas sp. TaxID=1963772 RepID=UPI002D07D405|nr:glutamate cyclase domain-containing protein [Collimonas sp.]HWW08248.1 glutamate cyclase domain-containing protein [Collimonas sp.]